MIELSDLIGIKYKNHGRTKEEGFDCLGLVLEVEKRLGRDVADLDYEKPELSTFQKAKILKDGLPLKKIEKPVLYSIVIFGKGSYNNHVGIYIGGGKMLHCTQEHGVHVTKLAGRFGFSFYELGV